MGESDYSFSLTTFSPSGRLVQIEYALNAVTAGATALGIKGKLAICDSDCITMPRESTALVSSCQVHIDVEEHCNEGRLAPPNVQYKS